MGMEGRGGLVTPICWSRLYQEEVEVTPPARRRQRTRNCMTVG